MAEALVARITGGVVAIGDALPSMGALAREFGVSVPVVREALSDLRAQGLVGSRQGAATVVLADRAKGGFQIDASLTRNRAALRELFEFRADVESTMAAKAAARASSRDLKNLGEAVRRLQAHVLDSAEGVAADVAFHVAIAATAGKFHLQLVDYMTRELRSAIATARNNSAVSVGLPQLVQDEHEAIFEAIAARDPESARLAMYSHLVNAARRLGLRQGPKR